MMNMRKIGEGNLRQTFVAAILGLSLVSFFSLGQVQADPNGGQDHQDSKPKVIFHVGPVTKTPDPNSKGGDGKDGGDSKDGKDGGGGKGKDGGDSNTHH